jgi:hypothetical protein
MKVASIFTTMILVVAASILLIPFKVLGQNADGSSNPCLSVDPELGDSAYWANASLEFYAQENYNEAIQTVDACFNQWASGAVTRQQKFMQQDKKPLPLGEFTPSEKEEIYENYLLNDVVLALWVKARSLEEIGEIKSAKKVYSNCIYLSYGRAWDPKGWFWSPSDDCIKRGRKLLD